MEPSQDSPIREVRWVGPDAVVDAAGDIDLRRSVVFQHDLLALMDRKPERILINLRDVPYMDSSGIASLVKMLSRTRKSGATLLLCAMNDRVRSLFEITRLDSVFSIFGTEEEALA